MKRLHCFALPARGFKSSGKGVLLIFNDRCHLQRSMHSFRCIIIIKGSCQARSKCYLDILDVAGIHDAEDSDQAEEQAGVEFEDADEDETDEEQDNYLTDDSYDPDNMTYEVLMTFKCLTSLE